MGGAASLHCLLIGLALAATPEPARILLDPGGAIRVAGWDASRIDPAQGPQLLAVYVEPRAPESPAMLGEYTLERTELVFRPRFPLRPGVRYRAVFQPPGDAPIEQVFELAPGPAAPATHIEQVFPTAAELPENILKFYIHFSAPMSRGQAYRHIKLLDGQGRAVELPFLEIDEELWDRDGRRMTVLFDPGRIKRGLVPHEEVGPPIVQGRRYTLVIDAAWPDAAGRPLREGLQRAFTALAPERRPVRLAAWRITPPRAGTSEPVEVTFPRPMDRALIERLISVEMGSQAVTGTIEVDRQETRWRFTPETPWAAGSYRLRVNTALEDISGNKVDRPFDVDVFERVEKQAPARTKSLPFRVK
jgi:hypothetical protein